MHPTLPSSRCRNRAALRGARTTPVRPTPVRPLTAEQHRPAIDTAQPGSLTRVGESGFTTAVSTPTCPYWLLPQQYISPSRVTPHPW